MRSIYVQRALREVKRFIDLHAPLLPVIKTQLEITLRRINLWLILEKIEPVTAGIPKDSDVEIMTLICHDDVLLYLCMIKTFTYYSQVNLPITVFDDGTLTEKDKHIIHRHVHKAHIISRISADHFVKKRFINYPNILYLRNCTIYMKKKIDTYAFARARKILYLDSDILFFRKPREILNWINDKGISVLFMNDFQNSYMFTDIEVKKFFRVNLIKRLNSGIIGVPVKLINFHKLEYMSKIAVQKKYLDQNRTSKLQVFFAILFASYRKLRKIRLSSDYILSMYKSDTKTVCKHYTSYFRKNFYTDAISLLKTISHQSLYFL